MKRISIITLFLLISITDTVFSQLQLNLSAGLNNSFVKFENLGTANTDTKLNYFVGLAPSFRISDKVRFQIEAQYSLKGYKLDQGRSLNITFSYLDLIPEVEYDIFEFLAIGVGLNYAIRTNEQIKSEDGILTNLETNSISSTDFGLTGKLKVKFNRIFGFVRYNLGVKDINELFITDVDGNIIEDVRQLNRNLQIGLGYQLWSNKK